MSKYAELQTLYSSWSVDAPLNVQSRSGDNTGAITARLDLYASTQSAEADIIEAEERAELRAGKKKFAQMLGLYFKKILTAPEFKFLAACIRSNNRTPCAIGRDMGVNYEEYINAITAKYNENMPRLAMLMRACGYDTRRGFVFMPKWQPYLKRKQADRRWARSKYARDPEAARAKSRQYQATHPEECRAYRKRYAETHAAETKERRKKYYAEHKEQEIERARARYRNMTPEQYAARRARENANKRKQRAANPEKFNEKQRLYRLIHSQEMNEKRRLAYGAKNPQGARHYGKGALFMKLVKERINAAMAMCNTFTFEFLQGALTAYGIEIENGASLQAFSKFYGALSDGLQNCLQTLYSLIVEGVPPAEILRIEQERDEERRREFEAEETSEQPEAVAV